MGNSGLYVFENIAKEWCVAVRTVSGRNRVISTFQTETEARAYMKKLFLNLYCDA